MRGLTEAEAEALRYCSGAGPVDDGVFASDDDEVVHERLMARGLLRFVETPDLDWTEGYWQTTALGRIALYCHEAAKSLSLVVPR